MAADGGKRKPTAKSYPHPPYSGNRPSTPTPQNPCQSKHPQAIRSPQIRAGAKSTLATTCDPYRSNLKRKTYGVAVRGKSLVAYHRNRPAGNHPRPRLAHPNPARELADFLRGPSIGRIIKAITSGEVNCLSGSCEPTRRHPNPRSRPRYSTPHEALMDATDTSP